MTNEELIEKLEIEQKLKQKELEFERQGNQVKAKDIRDKKCRTRMPKTFI